MPIARLCLHLLLWFGLAGCSLLPVATDPRADFETSLQQQNYVAAAGALQRLRPRQDSAELQQRLATALASDREQVLAEVDALEKKEAWQQAQSLLQTAIDYVPGDSDLRQRREALERRREQHLRALRLQLTRYDAAQLPDRLALLRRIEAASTGPSLAAWQLHRARQQGYQLVDDLLECAERALRRDRLEQAGLCLQPVDGLASDDQTQQVEAARRLLHSKLEAREPAPSPQASGPTPAQQRAQQIVDLKREYRNAVEAGWWRSAREKLSQLQRLAPDDPELATWDTALQAHIRQRVDAALRKGQRYYSRGQIEKALKAWRRGLRLQPDNLELQANVERARKFLEKLRALEDG